MPLNPHKPPESLTSQMQKAAPPLCEAVTEACSVRGAEKALTLSRVVILKASLTLLMSMPSAEKDGAGSTRVNRDPPYPESTAVLVAEKTAVPNGPFVCQMSLFRTLSTVKLSFSRACSALTCDENPTNEYKNSPITNAKTRLLNLSPNPTPNGTSLTVHSEYKTYC